MVRETYFWRRVAFRPTKCARDRLNAAAGDEITAAAAHMFIEMDAHSSSLLFETYRPAAGISRKGLNYHRETDYARGFSHVAQEPGLVLTRDGVIKRVQARTITSDNTGT